MSKIKEELIGYEDNDWIDYDDHVRVTEVEEYLFYAMSVAEMQQIARQHIDLRIDAAFEDQEMRHTVRYWEGAVTVSGSHAGVGYMELSGYAR
jgi:hypothetical protein